MESGENQTSAKQESPEAIPSLIQIISSNQLSEFDFDDIEGNNNMQVHPLPQENEIDPSVQTHTEEKSLSNHERTQSISISMPSSPLRAHAGKQVVFHDDGDSDAGNVNPNGADASTNYAPSATPIKQTRFYSQPMPKGTENGAKIPTNPRINALKDKRFDSFKTWSGRLERQLSNLRGKPRVEIEEEKDVPRPANDNLPVDRYFDALEGPELETLRPQEEIVLPDDKTWPFLLRFPVSSFGICLGVSSQAIMWKALATSSSISFLHISLKVNLILWFISIALVVTVSSIYLFKVILYFEAVRREYYHPIRVNFFFAPWIALLFLALGVPPSIAETLPHALWYVLMAPIFSLELKIYGQWMSGGQRRLSKVANPSNHLSVVGNFVGALLGASMGLKEGPIFFFSVGLAHYTVLFVTLYQRLPTNETLPKELHPVFFLFVAAPSVASMAWAKIQGSFDFGSRVAYFVALFLYFSLAVRINFFRGFRFSLAWWAYTFPMTGAAIATIRYSSEVTSVLTQILSVTLSSVATLTVFGLLTTTIIHAFVLRNLFPNDIAIAISDRRPKTQKKWFHLRHGSSDTKDIENYLKFSESDGKDIEASVELPTSDNKEVKLPV